MVGFHHRPQPDGSDRRPVELADVPEVAGTLARAFEPNPGMRWAFPGPKTRMRRLEGMFATMLDHALLPLGECVTTAGIDGAALWLPPGATTVPAATQLAMFPRLVAAIRSDTVRVLRFLAMSDRLHPKQPHWYLALLGVEPELHGRGYGTHLMAPGWSAATARARPPTSRPTPRRPERCTNAMASRSLPSTGSPAAARRCG